MLAICDAHEHAAWNDTDEPRVILVFDVMKPEYLSDQLRICGNVLAAITLHLLDTRLRLLSILPRPWLPAVHRSLGFAFRCWLPLQRIDWAGWLRAR